MTTDESLNKRPCEMPMDLSEPDVITRSDIDTIKSWLVPQPRPRQVRASGTDFENQVFCECYWCSMPR